MRVRCEWNARCAFRVNIEKDNTVSTTAKKNALPDQDAKPTISLANVISIAPSTGSFGGWGPKVGGSSNLLKTWN